MIFRAGLSLFFFLLLAGPLLAGKPGFTEEDRARLIRLEATLQTFMQQVDKRFEQIDKRFEQVDKRFEDMNRRIEELRQDTNARFAQVDSRFDQMMTFLWILTGIFVAITAVVIGFAYWDRRTIIRKAREDTVEYLEREGKLRKLIEALRELAREDRRLAEVLRAYGLL